MNDKIKQILDDISNLTGAELLELANLTGLTMEDLFKMVRSHGRVRVSYRADPLHGINKKIQAIKIYREITGEGLKDSKDVLDGNQDVPDRFIPDIPYINQRFADEWVGYKIMARHHV